MSSHSVIQLPAEPAALEWLYSGPAPVAGRIAQDRVAEAEQRGSQEAAERLSEQILDARREMNEFQNGLFARVESELRMLQDEIAQRLPGLVMMAARRVLAGYEPDAATVARTVEELLSSSRQEGVETEVRLSPADLDALYQSAEGFATAHEDLTFVADPGLAPGDCQLRNRFGLVDGRVERKLERLGKELAAE